MSLIYFLLVLFALTNFYYFIYPKDSKIWKRFFISLSIILFISIIVALSEGKSFIVESIVTFVGYYILLFFVHLLIMKVILVRKYSIYVLVFSFLTFLITVFYTALMQEIFNYS